MLVNIDCPVELLDYKLYKSKSTGDIYSSLIFNNISDKVVQAIKANVYCYDQFDELIDNENYIEAKVEYDHGLYPNIKQEIDEKISLYKDTRKIEVEIESVLFKDKTIWEKGSTQLEEVELHAIKDTTILNYLEKHIGHDAKYFSENYNDKWSCICGRFNYHDQLTCKRCKRKKDVNLKKYSNEDDLYNEMERVKANEEEKKRQRQEKEQKEIILRKQKRKRVLKYTSLITVILLLLGIFTFGHLTKYTFSWDNYQLLKEKDNALIESVKNEDTQKIEFLKSNGANPNFVNDNEENAIAEAIKLGNNKIVTSLLNENANKIAVGENKDNIAQIAIKKEQLNILKDIHKSGFDMDVSNEGGETVLYSAIEKGNSDIVDYLTQEVDLDLQTIDSEGNNALQVAFIHHPKNTKLIKSLLKLDIELETENENGDNTYKSAIISENIDVVKELVDRSLDLNNVDNKTNNALHIYLNTKKNDRQYVEELITEGTDVNGYNAQGYSPLYFAIKNSKQLLIEELLQNEANIDNVTEDGETALDVLKDNGGNTSIEFYIKEYSEDKTVYGETENNNKEDESTVIPSEEVSQNATNDVVINYRITKEGLVDIDSGLTDVNVKVGENIKLEPSIAEGVTERVLVDGSLLDPIEPTIIQASHQGVGYITIIPNEYDWENSVDINVTID